MVIPSSSSASSQKLSQHCRPSSLHQDPPSRARDTENLDPGVVHGKRQGGYKFKVLSIAIQDYKLSPMFKALTTPQRDQRIVVDYALKVGCRQEDICAMNEAAQDKSLLPTRRNILSKILWLVNGACSGDVLVFHYSGHGAQVPNRTGTEEDKKDEAIVTMDQAYPEHPNFRMHYIIDNTLRSNLVDCLAEGVTLIALLDACNSGTLLDLDSPRARKPLLGSALEAFAGSKHAPIVTSYVLSPSASFDASDLPDEKRQRTERGRRASRKDSQPIVDGFHKIFTQSERHSASPERYEHDMAGRPNVISISACQDSQVAWEPEGTTVTHCVFEILEKKRPQPLSFLELQQKLHKKLEKRNIKAFRSQRQASLTEAEKRMLRTIQVPKVVTLPGHEELLTQPFRFQPLIRRHIPNSISIGSALDSMTNVAYS